MSGLRFKVGELVVFAVSSNIANSDRYLGEVMCVEAVGPFRPGDVVLGRVMHRHRDYIISFGAKLGTARDWQIRKLDPPAEPRSIKRREEVEA